MIKFGKKTALGLDMGSGFVKLIELEQGMGKPELTSIAISALPQGTIVDGLVNNRDRLIDAIRGLLKSVRTSVRHVAISLSNDAVNVKKITIPEMSDSELNDHIIWEAEQYLPPEMLKDVHIDYNRVGVSSRPGHMDVMLVAAKRSAVKMYANALKEVGLSPRVVDVDCFALLNVFNFNHPVKSGKNLMLLNVGATSTNMVIVRDGHALHTKEFEFGGKHFSEVLSSQLGISYEEAEAHKVRQTLQETFSTEFQGIIATVMREFSRHLKEAIEFFYNYNDDTPITDIYTAGGGSKLPLFDRYLQEFSGINTRTMDIFKRINYNSKVFDDQYIRSVMPIVSISTGLALRQLDAK